VAARGASNKTAGMTSISRTTQHRGTTISAASNPRMPTRGRLKDDEDSTKICCTVSEADLQESRFHQPLSGEHPHQRLSKKQQR
jgi:hypothetical protein